MAFNNPECKYGLGCLLKNINTVGHGFPFLSLFVLIWIVITVGMMYQNNHFIKSLTASTFIMLLISIPSWLYGLLTDKLFVIIVVSLSLLSAVNVYLSRKY